MYVTVHVYACTRVCGCGLWGMCVLCVCYKHVCMCVGVVFCVVALESNGLSYGRGGEG